MSNRINRIVFLAEQPFCARDYQRYGLDFFQDNGLAPEVWDVTPWLHPARHQTKPDDGGFSWAGHRLIRSRPEFEIAAATLNPETFVICLVGYRYRSWPIYRGLAKAAVDYAVNVGGMIPLLSAAQNPVRLYLKRVGTLTFGRLADSVFIRLPYSAVGVRSARILIASGMLPAHGYPVDRHTETVMVHAHDYEIFLSGRDRAARRDPNLGVFLDQYLPSHPDSLSAGEKPPVTAARYYAALRRFFDRLEARPGVRIMIAAHPRSRYEDGKELFGAGREIVKAGTSELIARAGFVIMHYSTALSFAVLNRRPVIFTTTDELISDYQGPWVDAMAQLVGKKPINIDSSQEFEWGREMAVNEELYRKYVEKFLKPPHTPDVSYWASVLSKIRERSELNSEHA